MIKFLKVNPIKVLASCILKKELEQTLETIKIQQQANQSLYNMIQKQTNLIQYLDAQLKGQVH